jgi:hypothetical protein
MIHPTTLRHRIVKRLGEAGIGEEFKAEDQQLYRSVSLEFPPRKSRKTAGAAALSTRAAGDLGIPPAERESW